MKYRTHWVSGRFSSDADASWEDVWRTIEKWERAAKRNPRIEIQTKTWADHASYKNNYDPGSYLQVEIRTYAFEDTVEDAWASEEWQEAWGMSERVWKDISKEFFGMADDVKSDYDIRAWHTKRSSLSDKVLGSWRNMGCCRLPTTRVLLSLWQALPPMSLFSLLKIRRSDEDPFESSTDGCPATFFLHLR